MPDVDATVAGTGGLVVEWSSQPATWPADVGNAVLLESAYFELETLRVVGDAGPGDPRTTARGFVVRWDDDSKPSKISFAEAPTGLYSQVSLDIDGQVSGSAFELRGRVVLDGKNWEFKVEDEDPLAITVQIDETLSPPATTTVKLRVDFQAALAVIDYSKLHVDVDDDQLELERGDDQMPVFRSKLVESFQVEDGGGGGAPVH